jgi:hypothetical protein
MFRKIKPKDRLILKAVVCCLYRYRTISEKVDALMLTSVTFYLNKLIQHPIGARVVLPDHILKNKAVVALVGGAHGPYENNICQAEQLL